MSLAEITAAKVKVFNDVVKKAAKQRDQIREVADICRFSFKTLEDINCFNPAGKEHKKSPRSRKGNF